MTALKIIGVILLLLLLFLLLRVGVIVELGEKPGVRLRVGVFRWTIVPRKAKKPKKAKKAKNTAEAPKEPKAAKKRAFPKPTRAELRSLISTALRTLGRTIKSVCRRIRIDPLEVCVTFAGSDPAETAQNYGYANAALWSVMPRVEELFDIPAPSVTLRTDFEGERTQVEGTVGVSLRVCDLFAVFFVLAIPMGKWFLSFKKAHANDPPRESKTAEGGTDESKTEKLTA